MYLQVRDALAERIARGGFLPGSAFPSEGELAREIGVSAGTVRKALQLMESDHLIVRQQGRGTFVNDPASDEVAARFARLHGANGTRIRGQVKSTEIARTIPGNMERERLRLAVGVEVYRIRRVRCQNDAAFQVEETSLPADLFPGLGDNGRIPDHLTSLAQQFGILLGSAQERISLTVPPTPVAKSLDAASNMPVVLLDRVVFTYDSRRPLEWRLAYCNLPGSYYLAELR
ncbi:MAG TPA: GntR family transcriptional regulator [Hyphomicrobiaceae bacterium]|nr:GntR family transcriptional regulator [Hyphomicrobiaceae bacterium]